jgi:hypothetical protein
VVATEKLGLDNVILQEPSVGGRDLYTQDNTVAIQARLIIHATTGSTLQTTIQEQLASLIYQLHSDYGHQPNMKVGYAVLSFVDTDGSLKSIILEVPKS